MTSLLRALPASTAEMLEIFGDEALCRAALRFEMGLAAAQAAEGLISAEDAVAIAQACGPLPDIEILAAAAAHAGALAIPLVAGLRARLSEQSPAAADKVHLGATSQDLADTALMLQAKAALAAIHRDGARLTRALAVLAEEYAATPMLGRTLLQAALPITFGLKASNWLLGVDEALRRLEQEADKALLLQLGGPVGTLGGMGGKGQAVAARMAEELELGLATTPWHARRNGVAALAAALAILAGALGKMALDIALLAQTEVGEAFEPRAPGRGGSSAMAHKRNPTGCQVARSAAVRAPHLAATVLSVMAVEHERGLGGWQAEAPVLAELFAITHGALAAMVEVAEGLEVQPTRMAANLATANVGEDVGDAPALVAAAIAAWRGRS